MNNELLLILLIPCLNEEETITDVVEAAFRAGKKAKIKNFEILVADNGSNDGSVENVKKQKIARLIKVPVRGYGAALHWGILHAKGKYILFADADLSYDFFEMSKFLRFIQKNYDLVLGSRIKGSIENGAMPFLNRYIGTPFLTWLIRYMYRLKTTDCNSGMRLVRKDFYKSLHMRNSGMEWASELLCKTALNKGKYSEVPINFYKDRRSIPSHLIRWTDGWRHLKAILLLKPDYLFLLSLILIIFSYFLLKELIVLSLYLFLLSISLFLSTIAAKLLNLVIIKRESKIMDFVMKISIVKVGILITIIVALLSVIPSFSLEIRLLFIGLVVVFDMWVFLIETVKTHLVNTLPEP